MAKRHGDGGDDQDNKDRIRDAEHYPIPREVPEPAPKVDEPPPPPAPVLTALLPAFATIGDPNFALQVRGSGFTPASIIVFAGQDEPITFLTEGALTTGVNMALWLGPDPAIPVKVRNADGQESNELTFEFRVPVTEPVPVDPSQPLPKIDQIN